MKLDTVVAGGLFAMSAAKLLQKRLYSVLAMFLVLILVIQGILQSSYTITVALAVLGMYSISLITKHTWEGFENEDEEEDPKKPGPAPPKTSDPHVDVGTTILHAYRNLSPEQIGGMRRDTRELLELQKELMGSLGEMKPAIEQGAELLKTFSTFFGDSGAQGMM
jgi:prepilin signal peptidase PulO-like enzyme (type II secretory pathway)